MSRARFKNGAQFKLDLARFDKLTEEQHVLLLKKVAFQLLELIVTKNPVKTGRSQNNWQVAVDTSAGNATVTGGSKAAVLAGGLSKLAEVKPFGTVVLFNNVEYIVFLEEGTSTQAPEGMVQISILEVENQFR